MTLLWIYLAIGLLIAGTAWVRVATDPAVQGPLWLFTAAISLVLGVPVIAALWPCFILAGLMEKKK